MRPTVPAATRSSKVTHGGTRRRIRRARLLTVSRCSRIIASRAEFCSDVPTVALEVFIGMLLGLGGCLCGSLLSGFGLRCAIESGDSVYANLGHGLLRAVFGNKLARLYLADDLDMSALGERGCILRRAPERNTFVPRRLRFAISCFAVLPGPLCRQRE